MSQPGAEPTPSTPSDPGTTTPPAQPPQAPQTTVQVTTPAEPVETFDREYVEQLRREAAAARTANKTLQKKIDDSARAGMTEAERLVAEAVAKRETELTRDFGTRLATAEF